MKKRVVKKSVSRKEVPKSLGCGDVGMVKWASFFGAVFLIGLLGYWIEPINLISFIIRWKWVSLLLALLIGLKPFKKFCGRCQ